MAPCRCHLSELLLPLLLLAGRTVRASPVPGDQNSRHYDLLDYLHPDIDRQGIYDAFERYIAYPPYSSSSSSYGSSSNNYGSPSNNYGGSLTSYGGSYNSHVPPSDYSSSWGGSWSGSASSGGGYSSRHVLRLEPRCDCTSIDLLALLTGGTALCALGLFCILEATNGVSISTGSNVSLEARQLLAKQLPLSSWMVREDSWQMPAANSQQPSMLYRLLQHVPNKLQPVLQKLSTKLRLVLQKLPKQQLADQVTEATCTMARQLEEEHLGRSGECQCHSGLLGAVAGFAALGGLIVYSLQLASSAAGSSGRAMDLRWSGEPPLQPATDPRHGRAFETDGHGINRLVNHLGKSKRKEKGDGTPDGRLLEAGAPCVPFQLCRINRQAAGFGQTRHTLTRLASLPVSWLLSRSDHAELSFGRLCSALHGSADDPCHRRYPHCDVTA